jgi:hypothetical protein
MQTVKIKPMGARMFTAYQTLKQKTLITCDIFFVFSNIPHLVHEEE